MGFFRALRKFGELAEKPSFEENRGPVTLPTDHTLHKEDYKVIGVVYHMDSIAKLQIANPDWRKGKKALEEAGLINRVICHYDYVTKPVKLEKDPTGEFGPNRIMVFIAGEHVGYLPEDHDLHVGEILKYGSIKYITAYITGGEYKRVSPDGEVFKNTDHVEIKIRIAYSV